MKALRQPGATLIGKNSTMKAVFGNLIGSSPDDPEIKLLTSGCAQIQQV
jgi:hypothetical protein